MFTSKLGIRQGDDLSSILFNILINELPSMFNREDGQVSLNRTPLSCIVHVHTDDFVLLSFSQRALQQIQIICLL